MSLPRQVGDEKTSGDRSRADCSEKAANAKHFPDSRLNPTPRSTNPNPDDGADAWSMGGYSPFDSTRQALHRVQTAAERFPLYDGAALAALDCRVDYLIRDFLVAGQPCIVAGPKKGLKTGTLIEMGISLASGTPCFGRFDVPTPRRVLLMSGESGEAVIQETAQRIAASKRVDLSTLHRFKVSFKLPRLIDPADLVRLEELIVENGFEVVMIDPAYLAMAGLVDAGNLFSVGAVLWPLSEMGQRTGTTIIIAHHTKKTSGNLYAEPELGDIAWSGFAEWARQWVLLNRREPFDPESDGVHHLWLSVGGSAGHSGAWSLDVAEGRQTDAGGRGWNVALASAREERKAQDDDRTGIKIERKERQRQAQLEANAANLLRAIRMFPNGETITKIRQTAGLSGDRAVPAVTLLGERGEIEAVEIKKKGRTYDGYRPTTGT